MKVLIIKISSMGDIIHTLPAITDASIAIPNILFDWVVEETFSEIPQWHPAIHKIIPINLRSWKKKWYQIHSWKQFYKCIKQINKTQYDIVIDAQGLLKTAFLTANVRTGIKHGMDYISIKEPISCFFYHKQHRIKKVQHAIERTRSLFAYSLKYTKPRNVAQYGIAHLFQSIKKFNYYPYLIFIYSTTKPKKHWSKSNWDIIIQNAINSGYIIKLPFWTKEEEIYVQSLTQKYKKIIILPKLTLKDIAVQIYQATAVLSVDTGLSHLAAALNCPTLTLYGPTNPRLIGTYGKNQMILSALKKNMQYLNANYVWKIFQKTLNLKS